MAYLREIHANRTTRQLILEFDDEQRFSLPFEYLRVFSPSAEVSGQSGPHLLMTGKEKVDVTAIEQVGNYAIRIIFDDGHESGLYSWSFLRELAEQFEARWTDYKARIAVLHKR